MNKKIIYFLLLISMSIFILLFNYNSEKNNTICITDDNYPIILEDAHNNIDKYINKIIIVEGYIYRNDNFNKNNFVIAKDMYISAIESVVIGFLCNASSLSNLENGINIKIKGKIKKGYFNDMEYPILSNIKILS